MKKNHGAMPSKTEFIPVLSLSPEAARKHLLRSEYYTDLELPSYFCFDRLLNALSDRMGSEKLYSFRRKGMNPARISRTNITVYTSRDGHDKIRAYQLIHPVIYASLVNEISKPAAWHALVSRSQAFHCDPRMSVASRPSIPDGNHSYRATKVRQWYEKFEQQSIELSMNYKVLLSTDIKNCYPSMRPGLFEELLDVRCSQSDPETLGTTISRLVGLMTDNSSDGLPVGCPMMDVLADVIFGYIDWQFFEALREAEKKGKIDFQVIRYQDDYRFFCHDEVTAQRLYTIWTDVLSKVGLVPSKEKTAITTDVLGNSIKPDKLYWLSIPHSSSLKEELLRIRELGARFQNSGSVVKALSRCLKEIDQFSVGTSAVPHLAVLAEIMHQNPRTYPIGCALIERLAKKITDPGQRLTAMRALYRKLVSGPYTELLTVWLQCVLEGLGFKATPKPRFCKYVSGELDSLWNTSWLNSEIASLMKNTSIIDAEKKSRLNRSIPTSEVCLFERAS